MRDRLDGWDVGLEGGNRKGTLVERSRVRVESTRKV